MEEMGGDATGADKTLEEVSPRGSWLNCMGNKPCLILCPGIDCGNGTRP